MHAQKTYDIAGCCRPGFKVDDKPQPCVQVTGSLFVRISWISTTLMQCTLRYPGWSLCTVRSKKRKHVSLLCLVCSAKVFSC